MGQFPQSGEAVLHLGKVELAAQQGADFVKDAALARSVLVGQDIGDVTDKFGLITAQQSRFFAQGEDFCGQLIGLFGNDASFVLAGEEGAQVKPEGVC